MYQNIKPCIRKGEECSVFVNSEVGVKQGENMSPFLFSLFLNDLEIFFLENNISDLEQISKNVKTQLQVI
jgi:hypothetical protein